MNQLPKQVNLFSRQNLVNEIKLASIFKAKNYIEKGQFARHFLTIK